MIYNHPHSSPYIFMLCLERLAHLISWAVNQGRWKPIRVGRHGPALSHLLFADDLILFAEVSIEQIKTVMDCLNTFCVSSGQRVSVAKTRIDSQRMYPGLCPMQSAWRVVFHLLMTWVNILGIFIIELQGKLRITLWRR